MFLMNVPPVAVTPRTEWITCGTQGGYSLPLCLNDSDSDLSTRGTPISDKVQMIIESLRSTQSSEMGDDKERKVQSGQEGLPQVCKIAIGSFVGANSKAQGPIVNQKISPSTICNDSHDSDSDDSVDRGIEEAILEYLKEKDGPKQKSEPCSDDFQPSKIPRSPSPIPGISRLNSDSCAFLTASKDLPKSTIIAKPITPTTYPIKKYIKHKASITESSCTKQDSDKLPSELNDLPIGQTNQPSKYLSDLLKLRKNPEECTDSSSDDGIEEAIQKYQIEKNQQYKTDTQQIHTLSDSDSTSDDGIEEAIRHYQLEQLKKKSILTPLLNKAKTPASKCTTTKVPSTGTIKKHKLKKKRNKMKKELLSVSMPSNTLLDCTKGNVLHSFKVEGFKGQPTPKTNTTTAELMCAEAILDISKTVMPGAFQQTQSLSNTSSVGACARSLLPDMKPEDESDDTSIDSEDGIEQEIRRFLEQKAQMQKQTIDSAAAPEQSKNEGEAAKTKDAKKPGRLSLTKKRKQKTEKLNFCTTSALSNVKDAMFLPDSNDESTPPASPVSKLQKKEQSGDKSSSLDSDEDLDLAIKDLLKTKKKLKKKTRDLKRKPEKCIKKELQGSVYLSKKSKLDPPKQSCLKQSGKTNYELSYSTLPKDDISQNICYTSQEYVMKAEGESCKGIDMTISTQTKPIKDEDSSVDSDDSIELEIRKFLAEKAKVATAEHNKNKTVSTNGMSPVCAEDQDVQLENQRAEIPSTNILLPGQSTEHRPLTENKPPEEKVPLLPPQDLTPRNSLAGAQSLSPSSPTCSQSLLEPADGAGAATDARRTPKTCSGTIQSTCPSKEGQSVLNPNLTASQSASIKWRQSLGLPITDAKIRTPFQVTSSKMYETSTRRPYENVQNFKVQNPVWSSAKTITASFPRNTETGFHPHALNLLSSPRQHPGPFRQALATGRSPQFPIEEETKSMVHISKDKSVYVELETNRTNHVQVRSRDRSEGKEFKDLLTANNNNERISGKMEEKVCSDIKEENFIDEADYESGNKSNQEKKQGLSTLSLSSAIDPGFTFKPCIALSTEERCERFSRRCMDASKCTKGKISWRSGNLQQSVQHVKRKLQFVPVLRRNDATSLQI